MGTRSVATLSPAANTAEMPQKKAALAGLLREIRRLGLPPPWVIPTMLDIANQSARFGACWLAESGTLQRIRPPHLFAQCALGYSDCSPSGPSYSPDELVGSSRIVFTRSHGDEVFNGCERDRLDIAAHQVAGVINDDPGFEISRDDVMLDGPSESLVVGKDMSVVYRSQKAIVLRRCAIHFGNTAAALIENPELTAEHAQQLWDAIRFSMPPNREGIDVSGYWGSFRIRIGALESMARGQARAEFHSVQVTQQLPRALRAILAFNRLKLSPREVEACRWIMEGLQKPEIAQRMHIAESTVRSSVKSVYARLGIASRQQLVALATLAA